MYGDLLEMSAAERKAIPDKDFVFPDRKAWPIQDLKHAKLALQYIKAKRGDSKDWPVVKKAVLARYPQLRQKGMAEMLAAYEDELIEEFMAVAAKDLTGQDDLKSFAAQAIVARQTGEDLRRVRTMGTDGPDWIVQTGKGTWAVDLKAKKARPYKMGKKG